MPTVLRVGEFTVRIFLPPREHVPPHVHVSKGEGTAIIVLGDTNTGCSVRRVYRMKNADVARAARIVEEHLEDLKKKWEKHHGAKDTY